MNELLQIPKPYLLLGDLNSCSTVWGCKKKKNDKGKDLEKVLQNNNLCILNNKSHTFFNSFTGSYSAINMTLCDPVSYMDYGWKVHDLCGSDHFPILLEILQPIHDEKLPYWKLNKANWEVFETLCELTGHGPTMSICTCRNCFSGWEKTQRGARTWHWIFSRWH